MGADLSLSFDINKYDVHNTHLRIGLLTAPMDSLARLYIDLSLDMNVRTYYIYYVVRDRVYCTVTLAARSEKFPEKAPRSEIRSMR